MIGNLLTLVTAIATCGVAVVVFQNLFLRPVRVVARAARETSPASPDSASGF